MKSTIITSSIAAGIIATALSTAQGIEIRVDVQTAGPVGLAPVFVAFHDGSFDTFDQGSAASAALETLAEVGNPGDLVASVPASANAGAITGVGDPILPPGTAASSTFDVDAGNSQLSYAAMILPSNDWFVGNDQAADISSVLNGGSGATMTMVVRIQNAYDAATENEDFAFSAGNPIAGIPAGDAPGGVEVVDGTIFALSTGADPYQFLANAPADFNSADFDFSQSDIAIITITNVSGLNGASASLPDAIDLGGDYAYSDAFGIVYTAEYPFLYQQSLGWVYSTAGEQGHYFYSETTSGWNWSDGGVWPAYYDFAAGDWASAQE